MHLPYAELEARILALPPAPQDAGRVALVVVRPEVEARITPERCRLTPQAGTEGDRWSQKLSADPECQVTLMRADVAQVFANGQSLSLFGDNLLVELDLSTENLPAGTRLRIGTALCEVTPKPHTGCGKFEARFGKDARSLTFAPEFVDCRLRGIHVRVLEAGDVSPGDQIEVVARPAPELAGAAAG
jgi:MOSC domain-containing protein YiiM